MQAVRRTGRQAIAAPADRPGGQVDFVTGRAPLTPARLRRCLAPVVAPDILRVTDGHPAYLRARAASRTAPSTWRQGVRVAGALHVQNVNAYHSRFKQWAAAIPWRRRPLPAELPWVALGRRWRENRFAGDAAEIGARRFHPLSGDIAKEKGAMIAHRPFALATGSGSRRQLSTGNVRRS
jgi:hypothetical protein